MPIATERLVPPRDTTTPVPTTTMSSSSTVTETLCHCAQHSTQVVPLIAHPSSHTAHRGLSHQHDDTRTHTGSDSEYCAQPPSQQPSKEPRTRQCRWRIHCAGVDR